VQLHRANGFHADTRLAHGVRAEMADYAGAPMIAATWPRLAICRPPQRSMRASRCRT
jgi:hypothetical protein